MKGWLNTDMDPKSREIVFLDATKPLPFKDYNFNYVFAEHCIEHLTYNEGLCMLRECYRILKPGGRIRIATPSLETLVGLYTPHKSELQQRFISWIIDSFLPEVRIYNECFVVNNAFRNPNWGHKFIYDRVTLEMAMKKSGFTNVAHYMPGQSDDAVLRGIEAHGLEDMNRFETMVLEAERSLEVDNPS
jgi:predicted SAM-dependent methyltransferase